MLKLAAVLVALAFVPTATAVAQTKVVSVPGTLVFEHGENPDDPGNCSAAVFVQWKDRPDLDVQSVKAFYGPEMETSKLGTPPYDDTYDWVRVYTAPPGTHRLQISVSWGDGPIVPNDCADMNARNMELYPDREARVELTVDDSAKCAAAQRKVTEAGRETLAARVAESRAITPKQQRKAEKALRKAERAERKARRKASRVCAD